MPSWGICCYVFMLLNGQLLMECITIHRCIVLIYYFHQHLQCIPFQEETKNSYNNKTKEKNKYSNPSTKTVQLQPVVLSGPSGAGKSTLIKMLMDEFPGCFSFSISHTTRKPRSGEENGKDYHFVTRHNMQTSIENGEFIEHTVFSGNMYGTSEKSVHSVISSGKICILDVDVQGVKSIKRTRLNPRYIFIQAPSQKVLEERLRGRHSETNEGLYIRLKSAKEALDYAQEEGAFDHIIINDDKDRAFSALKAILYDDVTRV